MISGTADHLEVHRPGCAAHGADAGAALDDRSLATGATRGDAGAPLDDRSLATGATGGDAGAPLCDRPLATGATGAPCAPVGAARAVSSRGGAAEVTNPSACAALYDRPLATGVTGAPCAPVGAARAASSRARAAEVTSPSARAHVGADNVTRLIAHEGTDEPRPSRLAAAIVQTEAKAALTTLGWKPAVAHAAVAAAMAAHGVECTLERLVFEALRRCPAPKA